MLWMIDNYDSGAFELVQSLRTLGAGGKVVRNDQLSLGFGAMGRAQMPQCVAHR